MAKTVTIPDCSSTFDVFLNGAKYSFIGGTEVEVEDAIANLIEQHTTEHQPKEAPKTAAPFEAGGESLVELVEFWSFNADQVGAVFHCSKTFDELKELSKSEKLVFAKRRKVRDSDRQLMNEYDPTIYYFAGVQIEETDYYAYFYRLDNNNLGFSIDEANNVYIN